MSDVTSIVPTPSISKAKSIRWIVGSDARSGARSDASSRPIGISIHTISCCNGLCVSRDMRDGSDGIDGIALGSIVVSIVVYTLYGYIV